MLRGKRITSIKELKAEVLRLRKAIQKHRDATGHELCWLNDVELWKVLDGDAGYPHDTLPVREEFLRQCARFHESRLKGTAYKEPKAKEKVQKKD